MCRGPNVSLFWPFLARHKLMDQVPVTYGPKCGYRVSEDYDPFHPFSARIMAITISAISVQVSAGRVFHPCTVSILMQFPTKFKL